METAVKLAEAIEPQTTSVKRCEICGYRLPEKNKRHCRRCAEVEYRKRNLDDEQKEKRIIQQVGERYANANLSDIDKEIRDKLLNIEYDQDIFVFGPVGVGKTYTAAALLRHYIYEGYQCKRINFDAFCVRVRSTFSAASKQTEWELSESLKNVDRLFVDDLGIGSKEQSDFAYHTFYELLNSRQERMLSTIITTNKSVEQLARSFDARIESRLNLSLIIEMKGGDRRLLK